MEPGLHPKEVSGGDGRLEIRTAILAAALIVWVSILAGFLLPVQNQAKAVAAISDDSDVRAAKRKTPPPVNGRRGYKGIILADVNPKNSYKDELVADLGSLGIWIYEQMTWTQISGADPDWIGAVSLDGTAKMDVIANLGDKGLWKWVHNGYPGDWTQLTGKSASWAIALDDDNDKRQELHVVFGTPAGIWRYKERPGGASSWTRISPLTPDFGLRTATQPGGPEEGAYLFSGAGVWTISCAGGEIQTRQLTGTETVADDNASARFLGGGAEDLIIDFGPKGLWLCENTGHAWNQISGRSADRVLPVRFGRGTERLVVDFNGDAGLYFWTFGGYPGRLTKLHPADPDAGFCVAFESDETDKKNGTQKLAVDFGNSGLWTYDFVRTTWAFINAKNPVFMESGDYWGLGYDSTLAVSFGPDGLWLYEAKSGRWYQISNNAPDGGL